MSAYLLHNPHVLGHLCDFKSESPQTIIWTCESEHGNSGSSAHGLTVDVVMGLSLVVIAG